MRPTLIPAPPTEAELSRAFGIAVPSGLASLVEIAHARANGDAIAFRDCYFAACTRARSRTRSACKPERTSRTRRRRGGSTLDRAIWSARDGWRHIATRDGVGAAAPESAFVPGLHVAPPERAPAEACVRAARSALDAGYAGTALAIARDGYWEYWSNEDADAIALIDAMARCYRALGRDALARIANAHAAAMRERA